MINETIELLVGYGGVRAEFNDTGWNGFAKGNKFVLMLVFGLIKVALAW